MDGVDVQAVHHAHHHARRSQALCAGVARAPRDARGERGGRPGQLDDRAQGAGALSGEGAAEEEQVVAAGDASVP